MTGDLQPSTRTASPGQPGPAVEITLNGVRTTVSAPLSIETLVADVAKGPAVGLAVAVNEAVVPRAQWPSRHIAAGDVIEIVRATRGG